MRWQWFLAAGLLTTAGQLAAAEVPGSTARPNPLIEQYRQVLAVDPDNAPLRYLLGVALLLEGEDGAALTELRRAYPQLAESVDASFHLGLACVRAGDPDSALLYFDQAAALGAGEEPEVYPLPDAWYSVGLLYFDAGQLAAAREVFERVLAADPGRAEAHRLLGELHSREGDTGRAVEAFGRYLQIHPEDETTRESLFALHFGSALEWLEAKGFREARQALNRGLELLPESPLALYHLGHLEFSEKKIETAAARLHQALPNATPELRPGIRSLLYDCAQALFAQGRLRPALSAIAPLIEGGAAEARELALAGDIHLALREFTAAHQCYRQALALEAGSRTAQQHLPAARNGAVQELLASADRHLRRQEYRETIADLDRLRILGPANERERELRRRAAENLGRQAAGHFAAASRSLSRNRPGEALADAYAGLALAPADRRGIAIVAEARAALQGELAHGVGEGRALLARNRPAGAQAAFDRVLALDPENTEALEGLEQVAERRREAAAGAVQEGERALEAGDLAGAHAAFAQALRWEPENRAGTEGKKEVEGLLAALADEALRKGRQAAATGRLEEAREHFLQAQGSQVPGVERELAAVEQTLDRRAQEVLKAARRAGSIGDYPRARTLYARLGERFRRPEVRQEEIALEKEIAATAADRLAQAAVAWQEKNFPAAVAGFRSVLQLAPADRQAREGLQASLGPLQEASSRLAADGRTAFEAGDLNGAESLARQALAIETCCREARALLERVRRIRHLPESEWLYRQGIELYTEERYEEAIAAWEQVLTLSPGHESARVNIDRARRRQLPAE